MNAEQFVSHIGLTENFDSLTAKEKVEVVQKLAKYNESINGNSILWPIFKFVFGFFPSSSIPNRMLKGNYKGVFSFSKKQQEEFRKKCREVLLEEIEKLNSKYKPAQAFENLNVKVSASNVKIEGSIIEKTPKPNLNGESLYSKGFLGAWDVVIYGTRTNEVATKNIPTLRETFVVAIDNRPTLLDLEKLGLVLL